MQRTHESRVLMEKTKRAAEAFIAKWKSNGLISSEEIAEDVHIIGLKCNIVHVSLFNF